MGQKIHPLGFRVGITKKHQSVWFARFHKHQYAQSVLEDRFLRQTLHQILPQLFQKKFANSPNMPKISHIQIVRGLIPYEIGIQIHANNCHLIKTALDGLDLQPIFVQNLVKNHGILEKTKTFSFSSPLGNERKEEEKFESTNSTKLESKEVVEAPLKDFQTRKKTSTEKKREIFAKFRERFFGKFVLVKNGKKITKKFDASKQNSLKTSFFTYYKKNSLDRRFSKKSKFNLTNGRNFEKGSFQQKALSNFYSSKISFVPSSKPSSKFVNFYMSQTNTAFLNALKTEMNNWNNFFHISKEEQLKKYGTLRFLPIGVEKKWTLSRLKRFEKFPVSILAKLYKALQARAFQKLERLRKEYFVFGKFSKTKTCSYYQRIRFLQEMKKFLAARKLQSGNFQTVALTDFPKKTTNQKFISKVTFFTEKALQKKQSTFQEEKNTLEFVEYLQTLVKQHRSKNLFLYLATLSDARRQYKKIQRFTKEQAEFLFGISSKKLATFSPEQKQKFLKNQVSKTLFRISEKTQQKNFQDIFVQQLQKQRTICEQNIQLTPKISLQFYSVKAGDFATRASAVADAIVDDLEKRKAFRGVMKKTKESLMKTPQVKGVKIQLSGRLNGAEIARSEWVRAGRVPLQTLRANIDYCYKTAQTIYGIIGVKVWIYKGYTKTRKPTSLSPSLLTDLL